MNEIVFDGVTYVEIYPFEAYINTVSNPVDFLKAFDEKKRKEILLRFMENMVMQGKYKRKEDYEKEHSIYGKDELFYGM
jgi:hypothetical protein